jgi:hypothetical protein
MLVPGDLEKIIQQCLESSPDARPESAAKMGDALRTIRRRIGNAPAGPQIRTEATLLGAVADVKGKSAPPAGPATATFVPAVAPGGRFGQVNNADARIAQGVLTSELAQQASGTQRMGAPAPAPALQGKFGDAIEEGGAGSHPRAGERTAAPGEVAPPVVAEAPIAQSAVVQPGSARRADAPEPVGTLDPTVPTAPDDAAPPAPRTRRARAVVGVVVAGSALLVCAALLLRGRGSPAESAPSTSTNAAPRPTGSSPPLPAPIPAPVDPPAATGAPPPSAAAQPAPTASATPRPAATAPAASASAPAAKGNAPAIRSKPGAKAHDAMSDWLEPEKPATAAPKSKKSDAPSLESF